jgi:Glycerol dehydrogenase and related enzymes
MSLSPLPEVIDIGPGAAKRLAAFCAKRCAAEEARSGKAWKKLRLVADRNTWKAMGEEVQAELKSAGLSPRPTIFEEGNLSADAASVFKLLVDDDPDERLYVAVGSGTITDIVRFATHRTGRAFVSMATAPSVDAYASIVAPMLVEGMKRTVAAQAPLAVFADNAALAAAPAAMIAAGFGDVVCKYSAVADWRLGALLWDEVIDEAIARRSVEAARSCVEAAASIGQKKPEGLAVLMAALVESGLCMAEAGNSKPASGAEHQYSHFWEMRLIAEHRPPVLHGLKVGIGTLEAARLWDAVRGLSKEAAAARLSRSPLPDRSAAEQRIRSVYRGAAEETIASQRRFLALTEADYEALKAKILGSWDSIQGYARTVPSRAETERLLELAHCPTEARELGLGEREIAESLECAHYIRDRFTVKKLALMLGID